MCVTSEGIVLHISLDGCGAKRENSISLETEIDVVYINIFSDFNPTNNVFRLLTEDRIKRKRKRLRIGTIDEQSDRLVARATSVGMLNTSRNKLPSSPPVPHILDSEQSEKYIGIDITCLIIFFMLIFQNKILDRKIF